MSFARAVSALNRLSQLPSRLKGSFNPLLLALLAIQQLETMNHSGTVRADSVMRP